MAKRSKSKPKKKKTTKTSTAVMNPASPSLGTPVKEPGYGSNAVALPGPGGRAVLKGGLLMNYSPFVRTEMSGLTAPA